MLTENSSRLASKSFARVMISISNEKSRICKNDCEKLLKKYLLRSQTLNFSFANLLCPQMANF